MVGYIIDNFSGDHGPTVDDAFDETFTHYGRHYDLGASSVSIDEINAGLKAALEYAKGPADVTTLNLSFGSGTTVDSPEVAKLYNGMDQVFETTMSLWKEDVFISFAAGNSGDGSEGVSWLAGAPWVEATGALNGQDGIASYSDWGAGMTGAFANGDIDGVRGTSFASPRVAAAFGEVKEETGLNNAEVLTLYEQTADTFVADGSVLMALDADAMTDTPSKEAIQEDEIVDAFYRAAMGRNPDEAGSDYWTDYAETNGTHETVLRLAEGAKANDDFAQGETPLMYKTKALYNVFLHREAGLDGMAYWMDRAVEENGMETIPWSETVEAFVEGAKASGEEVYHDQALDMLIA